MFYTDYDESVNAYCVFNTESEFAYSSYASEVEADQDAEERNKMNEFYVGQKLMKSPFDTEPSFEIVKIFHTLTNETEQYRLKDIHTGRLQVTTKDFLYPMN